MKVNSLRTATTLFGILVKDCLAQNLRVQPGQCLLRAGQSDSEVGGAFLGFILGPILFIMSFVVIWYNQKRAAINTTRLIKIKSLLAAQANNQIGISSENVGEKLVSPLSASRLIYTTGTISVDIPAKDTNSALTGDGWLKINRKIQVYEFRTTGNKKKEVAHLGWYTYHSPSACDQKNDAASWFMKTEQFVAAKATVNEYTLNQKEMKSMTTNINVKPTIDMVESIRSTTNRLQCQYLIEGDFIYFPAENINKLSPGTLRVTYTAFKPDQMSFIASYNQSHTLQPFRIDLYENKGQPDTLCCEGVSACCMCNGLGEAMKPISQIDLVMQGRKTENQMIGSAIAVNKSTTNLLRIAAYFVMVFGVYAFFSPLVDILGYIPLVGGFLKGVAGTLVFLAALIVCIPLFLATFSLAWLVYHPKTGVLLLLLSLAITALVIFLDNHYST